MGKQTGGVGFSRQWYFPDRKALKNEPIKKCSK